MMGDGYSWEDSDIYEEDDSWLSDPESLCNQWRGWRAPSGETSRRNDATNRALSEVQARARELIFNSKARFEASQSNGRTTPSNILQTICSAKPPFTLTEMATRVVALHIPFEAVERYDPPVPEQLQLRIAYWSFPDSENDIRLYACLANGSPDEYARGEILAKTDSVTKCLQIGFHLNATVSVSPIKTVSVSVTFDRRKIITCKCSCTLPSVWCSHVVAVCLYRISQPHKMKMRAPISESLHRLTRHQLIKLAQYLITDLPHSMLPRAQKLIDDLTIDKDNEINKIHGAPDPTAGSSFGSVPSWRLDQSQLRDSIRKIVVKLSFPSPMVFSDVNFLSSSAPPAASEWSSLLRPLRAKEPEGLWNLLSIVRELIKRNDRNAFEIMKVFTEEVLTNEQLVLWWFTMNVSNNRGYPALTATNPSMIPAGNPVQLVRDNQNGNAAPNQGNGNRANSVVNNGNANNNNNVSMYNTNVLCDEMISLWRLLALNPYIEPCESLALFEQLYIWHLKALHTVSIIRPYVLDPYLVSPNGQITYFTPTDHLHYPMGSKSDAQMFSGFKPAMTACMLDWEQYQLPIFNAKPRFNRFQINFQSSPERNHWRKMNTISVEWAPQLAPKGPELFDSLRETTTSPSHPHHFMFIEPVLQEIRASQAANNNSAENARVIDHETNEAIASVEMAAKVGLQTVAVLKEHSEDDGEARDLKLVVIAKPVTDNPHVHLAAKLVYQMDQLEMMFMRAEALFAFGKIEKAIEMSLQLAERLTGNPPKFQISASDLQQTSVAANGSANSSGGNNNSRNQPKRLSRCRPNPELHRVSLEASAYLSRIVFLTQVLSERKHGHFHAYLAGLTGLEMTRPPASTKALEVKMAYQEQELVTTLKRISVGESSIDLLRSRARKLAESVSSSRGEWLLPLNLASLIFDAMVLSFQVRQGQRFGYSQHCTLDDKLWQRPSDERLAYQAATAVLAMKANVAEAEHPLLCEGIRRQRGDLALVLLTTYKDNKDRLEVIMTRLLDRSIHEIFKSEDCTFFTLNNLSTDADVKPRPSNAQNNQQHEWDPDEAVRHGRQSNDSYNGRDGDSFASTSKAANPSSSSEANLADSSSDDSSPSPPERAAFCKTRSSSSSSSGGGDSISSDNSNKETPNRADASAARRAGPGGRNGGQAAMRNQPESSSSSTMAANRGPSDPSPVMHRYLTPRGAAGQPGRGLNVNGQPQLSAGGPAAAQQYRNRGERSYTGYYTLFDNGAPAKRMFAVPGGYTYQMGMYNGNLAKPTRFKGFKRNQYPTLPNQPSEASAHFMHELAKAVLARAGGSSSSVLFSNVQVTGTCRVPHRNLHQCALYIALYAIGLHNQVTSNWMMRTYSTIVSFIESQALEIGHRAIDLLIGVWEGHLTPLEAAKLADQASRHQCSRMVKAGAELALSCLPHAALLQQSNIQSALRQCKEQGWAMLERALNVLENASQNGGIDAEILFSIARYWYELYEQERRGNRDRSPRHANQGTSRHNADEAERSTNRNTEPGHWHSHESKRLDRLWLESQATFLNIGGDGMGGMTPSVSYPDMFMQRGYQAPATHPHANPQLSTFRPPWLTNNIYRSDSFRRMFQFYQHMQTGYNLAQPQVVRAAMNPLGAPIRNMPPNSMYYYYPSQNANNYGWPLGCEHNMMHQPTQPQQGPPPIMQPVMLTPATMAPNQMVPPNLIPLQPTYGTAANNPAGSSNPNGAPMMHSVPQEQSQPFVLDHLDSGSPNLNSQPINETLAPPRELELIRNAFRCGMRAMRMIAEGRQEGAFQKYQRTSAYNDDLRWLLYVTIKLGMSYLLEFLEFAYTSINNAEVLFVICSDTLHAINHTGINLPLTNVAGSAASSGSTILTQLIRKCQQAFFNNFCTKVSSLSVSKASRSEVEEMVALVQATRSAYHLFPNGQQSFKEALLSLRGCMKNEFWVAINNALYPKQTAGAGVKDS